MGKQSIRKLQKKIGKQGSLKSAGPAGPAAAFNFVVTPRMLQNKASWDASCQSLRDITCELFSRSSEEWIHISVGVSLCESETEEEIVIRKKPVVSKLRQVETLQQIQAEEKKSLAWAQQVDGVCRKILGEHLLSGSDDSKFPDIAAEAFFPVARLCGNRHAEKRRAWAQQALKKGGKQMLLPLDADTGRGALQQRVRCMAWELRVMEVPELARTIGYTTHRNPLGVPVVTVFK